MKSEESKTFNLKQMKKLIYKLLTPLSLFLALGTQAQKGMQFSQNARTPEYKAWSNQLSTKPTAAWTSALDLFIRNCIVHGNWFQLDRMWVFATETQANARISVVN